MEAWTVLAIIAWMLLGAAIAVIAQAVRGWLLRKRSEQNIYGGWLGKACSVELHGEWTGGWTVVAVSHKGAVAVRKEGAKRSKWIPKENVPDRVRWELK